MDAQLRRYALALGVAALCAGAADVAAERRPAYGGEVVGSLLSAPVIVDPVQARSHAEVTLVGLLYDTLYRHDDTGAVVPHLAAGPPAVSEDGLEIRVALLPGVVFHDGAAVGAADAAASLRRLAKSEAGWLLAPVRGIEADGDAVVLRLHRQVPDVAVLLAAPAASVTPGGRAPASVRPVGSGPFRLETAIDRRRGRVALSAFDGHFAGRPYVDRLELRWYEGADEEARTYELGGAHLSLRGAVAFAGHQPKHPTEHVEGPATLLVYVGFGTAHAAVTRDASFRAALSFAISRNGFRSVGRGERVMPALHPAAQDIGGPVATAADRLARQREARAALDQAARRVAALRGGTVTLEVIIDRTRPDDREIAEKVVAALFRLGLGARITDLPAAEFAARVRRGACDLYIGQLPAPAPRADLAIAAAFAAGGDDWAGRELSRRPLDEAAAARAFAARLPIIPLFHRSLRVHHRRDLRGASFDVSARPSLADLFLLAPTKDTP